MLEVSQDMRYDKRLKKLDSAMLHNDSSIFQNVKDTSINIFQKSLSDKLYFKACICILFLFYNIYLCNNLSRTFRTYSRIKNFNIKKRFSWDDFLVQRITFRIFLFFFFKNIEEYTNGIKIHACSLKDIKYDKRLKKLR